MILSDVDKPLRKPRFRVYRPECHAWIEAGTIEVDDNRGLDASPSHDKQDVLSGRPHLEYENKRYAAVAAAFPVAYDRGKNLGRAAVDFPLTLESLEWKVDSLRSQVAFLAKDSVEKAQLIERLTVANERLTDTLIKLFSWKIQVKAITSRQKLLHIETEVPLLEFTTRILGFMMLVILWKMAVISCSNAFPCIVLGMGKNHAFYAVPFCSCLV